MAEVVICGGSVVGLSTAMMLARDGHEVTVLEGDRSPAPDVAEEAWEHWDRKGVPQFRQPHNLFARTREILDEALPGMIDRLVAAGCVWVDPVAWLPPFITDREPRPGDERLRFVTGRRPVLEAAFASAGREHPGVTVRLDTPVAGLRARSRTPDGVPHVDAVLLDTGEQLGADLIIDAMGRRTKLAQWLVELGATPPIVESEDSGFVYYTRYFKGSEQPATIGPILSALGSISLLTLAGDNGTWSVTVFGASDDTALHGLRDPERFTDVVRACPLHAHWLDGEPITDMVAMAGIVDRYRRFIVDGRPVATGVLAVGDAWACTNPSAGRGISVGLVHAQRLRDTVREGLDDPVALVRRFDEMTEADVTPFYRNQISADRTRFAEMSARRDGVEPASDPMMNAVGAAMIRDPDVFRGVMEIVTCLALPQAVFARPGFMDRVTAFAGETPMAIPGPDRAQLLGLIG
jgi:2-polyprenyl-6-methoxyphenol hydroxylase-like FAD-dependent oxidoreductase